MIKFVHKELETNVNVSQESPLVELARLLLGSLGVLVAVYLLLGLIVDIAVPFIPPSIESELGKTYADSIPRKQLDALAGEHLQEILDRLVKDARNNPEIAERLYRVYVVRDATVNAVALPGGNIMMFSGLSDQVKSDSERAFILAHELGHFEHRDHLRGLGRMTLMRLGLTIVLGNDDLMGKIALFSNGVLDRQFSQQQETAADEFALKRLRESGYNTMASVQFFERLKKLRPEDGEVDFLSTHPATQKRLEHMKELIQNLACP